MNKVVFPYQPVQPLAAERKQENASIGKSDFRQLLDQEINPNKLHFSKHARQRLQARNIELDQEDLEKLQTAVGKARDKGARDSLIIMDKLALVVSIKNNTVITAVDEESIQDNVFTNIDSAVIM
jgi:flagellar operon protein